MLVYVSAQVSAPKMLPTDHQEEMFCRQQLDSLTFVNQAYHCGTNIKYFKVLVIRDQAIRSQLLFLSLDEKVEPRRHP